MATSLKFAYRNYRGEIEDRIIDPELHSLQYFTPAKHSFLAFAALARRAEHSI